MAQAIAILTNMAWQFWSVLCEMAPYLLFGFFMAGLLSVLISPRLVEKHLGGRGLVQVVKAVLFGIPLPLCSCGVIPVSASLRRHGASKAATISFLLSTSQTGIDSILVTYSLLGLVIAFYRPIAAVVSGLVGGVAVHFLDRGGELAPQKAEEMDRQEHAHQTQGCKEECCDPRGPQHGRLWRMMHYGFLVLPEDIGKSLLMGLGVAALLGVAIPNDFFSRYPELQGGIAGMLLMMLAGIPLYVCATASVPMAAMLWLKGMSPGAVLVFLMTGPASNPATLTMIWKVMGRRTALVYLASVAATALAAGFVLNGIFAVIGEPEIRMAMHDMAAQPQLWQIGSALALLALLGYAMIAPHLPGRRKEDTWSAAMEETLVLDIKGMTCNHCAGSVQRALQEVPGVEAAQVDLPKGKAFITGKDLDAGQLCQAVKSIGFVAATAEVR